MSPATVDVTCYYYEPLKAAALHDAVLPALRRIRADGIDGHVERHWLHGPHLQMRLSGPAGATEAAADVAAAELCAYVAAHPSRTDLDPADLLARSVASGRAELVPGPYEPIHPDNTVRVEPADDRHIRALLGSPATVDRRTDLLRAGVDPVDHATADLLARGDTSTARVWLALTAMAVHAHGYPPGIDGGYQSFLSHLEDFLYLHDTDGRIRERFAGEWERRGAAVTAHIARVNDPATRAADPVAAAWGRWVRDAWAICGPAYQRGELPLPGEEYAAQARKVAHDATEALFDHGRRGYSAYHLALKATDFLRTPGITRYFGPYRFATNSLYLLLALCDVTPLERYLAAYLLSQSVQRTSGVAWADAMAAHRVDDDPAEHWWDTNPAAANCVGIRAGAR